MVRAIVVLFGLMIACVSAQAIASDARFALIIGNADYADKAHLPRLNNSLNDAISMQQALQATGFKTTLVKNASRLEFYRAVEKFGEDIARDPNSVGLFYYAGHGAQDNGLNYLIPVDAKVEYASDLEPTSFDVRHVLDAMKEARNQMNIVVLDACRDNDLPKKRGGLRGLAKLDAPSGTFVAYAAAPGQGAYDGNEGANGVFTGEFLKAMREPGVPLEQMFKKVIAGVKAQTQGAQEPWSEASIQGEFFFIQAPPASTVTVRPPSAVQPSLNPPSGPSMEQTFWDSVKGSGDLADYKEYLKQYPNGTFAGLARNRIAALQPAPKPVETQVAMVRPPVMGVPIDNDTDLAAKGRDAIFRKDYKQALQLSAGAAERGNAQAQNNMGILYMNGLGVEQDYTQAMRWFNKAANQGFPKAQNNIGTMYEKGLGTPRDYTQAMQWYRKAADQGELVAGLGIGTLYDGGLGVDKDYVQALDWYKKAAAEGVAQAQYAIGAHYLKGWGVTQDYPQAMQWYRKAADQGFALAQLDIGVLYENGWSVQQNYDEAMFYYRKAADQGSSLAAYNIGVLFSKGWGVPQDYDQAMQWYRKGADGGLASAQNNIGAFYQNGQGVAQDYTQAMQWFRKAAEKGFALAQRNLGMLYYKGLGVPVDRSEARHWLELAAAQGDEEAKKILEKFASN
jgi:TPR repeat protein